jgi:hypothetical protein
MSKTVTSIKYHIHLFTGNQVMSTQGILESSLYRISLQYFHHHQLDSHHTSLNFVCQLFNQKKRLCLTRYWELKIAKSCNSFLDFKGTINIHVLILLSNQISRLRSHDLKRASSHHWLPGNTSMERRSHTKSVTPKLKINARIGCIIIISLDRLISLFKSINMIIIEMSCNVHLIRFAVVIFLLWLVSICFL